MSQCAPVQQPDALAYTPLGEVSTDCSRIGVFGSISCCVRGHGMKGGSRR